MHNGGNGLKIVAIVKDEEELNVQLIGFLFHFEYFVVEQKVEKPLEAGAWSSVCQTP